MSFRKRDGSSGPEPSTPSEWAEAVTYSYAILVLARFAAGTGRRARGKYRLVLRPVPARPQGGVSAEG
jgi:hypothetical protein